MLLFTLGISCFLGCITQSDTISDCCCCCCFYAELVVIKEVVLGLSCCRLSVAKVLGDLGGKVSSRRESGGMKSALMKLRLNLRWIKVEEESW